MFVTQSPCHSRGNGDTALGDVYAAHGVADLPKVTMSHNCKTPKHWGAAGNFLFGSCVLRTPLGNICCVFIAAHPGVAGVAGESPLALALVVLLGLVLALQKLQVPVLHCLAELAPWSALLLCSPVAGGALLLLGLLDPLCFSHLLKTALWCSEAAAFNCERQGMGPGSALGHHLPT